MFSFLAVGFSKLTILVVCFEVCFLLFYDKDQWITPTRKAASHGPGLNHSLQWHLVHSWTVEGVLLWCRISIVLLLYVILFFLFSVHVIEDAWVYLAVCLHVLPEILAEVVHPTGHRDMWAAANMLRKQAWGNKDIQSRSVNSLQILFTFTA